MIVMSNIPLFKGTARAHEKNSFVPGVGVKTFFRSLDNHFAQNNIQNDVAKLRILFANIDKNSGNAIDIANCFAGVNIPYDEVRETFLEMYPHFERTEYRYAAKHIFRTNLRDEDTVFDSMTSLEPACRALVESFLNSEANRGIGLTDQAEVHPQAGVGDGAAMSVTDVLKNFTLHLFTAGQLKDAVYDKVSNLTPRTSSTSFMSKVVQAVKKDKLTRASVRQPRDVQAQPAEVLYNVQPARDQPGPSNAPNPRMNQLGKSTNHNNQGTKTNNCYNCTRPGHFARECKYNSYCKYCRQSNHTLKACRKRIRDRVPYCTQCGGYGHEGSRCRRNPRSNTRRTNDGRKGKERLNHIAMEDEEFNDDIDDQGYGAREEQTD